MLLKKKTKTNSDSEIGFVKLLKTKWKLNKLHKYNWMITIPLIK